MYSKGSPGVLPVELGCEDGSGHYAEEGDCGYDAVGGDYAVVAFECSEAIAHAY